MKLIFGLCCDGGVYPDFPGSAEGVLAEEVVGPNGLLAALELQLGLTSPLVPNVVRVAAYAAKMRAALSSKADCFFEASFRRDPWATAESLLKQRDQLVLSGWRPVSVNSRRLDDLALIETSGDETPKAAGDRLFNVLNALEVKPQTAIESLTLVEDRRALPPAWGHFCDALEACGTRIDQRQVVKSDQQLTDLGKAKRFLDTGSVEELIGDGTVVLMDADTALMAAEALGDWLAAGPDDELYETVVIAPDGDTVLLDQVLGARGLPQLGQSPASPYRGALQVLPLAFEVVWKPFNPKPLLDLLLLPRPPVGRSAARKLARAITKEPGTGGPVWEGAWDEIRTDLLQTLADHPNSAKEVESRIGRWREWTRGALFAREDGMPAEAARLIAGRVAQWAAETDAGKGDPLLMAVVSAASAMAKSIDALGQDILPALLVERILEQVLANGASNPEHFATAGGLRCVGNAAAIWGPATRVIWWGFKGPGDKVPLSFWTRAETEALSKIGCELETSDRLASRISKTYVNAVHMAQQQLIFIRPSLSAGEETTSHPLAHQLHPLFSSAGNRISWKPETLLHSATHAVAQRTLQRKQVALVQAPEAQTKWTLPADAIAKLMGRRESPTSLEHMVDCQLRWLLSDVLRLSGGRFANIPGPDQLVGNLAHEIANRVFQPGPVGDLVDLEADTKLLFEDLLTVIAAPLQQPGYAGELAAARERVPKAIHHLARWLKNNNLEIVGTEVDRTKALEGDFAIGGRIDLLVRHQSHGLAVIDLKWSKSPRRRRNELKEGRALQLAAYGAIADETGSRVPGAYYLLNQRRLIGPAGTFISDEGVAVDRSLEQTWDDLLATWRVWFELAADGTALTAGAPNASELVPASLAVTPGKEPCVYCGLTGLCRIGVEEA